MAHEWWYDKSGERESIDLWNEDHSAGYIESWHDEEAGVWRYAVVSWRYGRGMAWAEWESKEKLVFREDA